MKTKITTKGWEVLNLMRRTNKSSESSTKLPAQTQILKHQNKKLAGITIYLSILTVNINELNSPIKSH
jgi:translation elongation factor EF-1alpha